MPKTLFNLAFAIVLAFLMKSLDAQEVRALWDYSGRPYWVTVGLPPDGTSQQFPPGQPLPRFDLNLPPANDLFLPPVPTPAPISSSGDLRDFDYSFLQIGVAGQSQGYGTGAVQFTQQVGNVFSDSTVELERMQETSAFMLVQTQVDVFEAGFLFQLDDPGHARFDTKTDMFTMGNDTFHDIHQDRMYGFWGGLNVTRLAQRFGNNPNPRLFELSARGGVMCGSASLTTLFDQTTGGGGITEFVAANQFQTPFVGGVLTFRPPNLNSFEFFLWGNAYFPGDTTLSINGIDSFGNPVTQLFTPTQLDYSINFGVMIDLEGIYEFMP
jgi:hypothetical protein